MSVKPGGGQMDNSPRFSDVSSFAYSDELNFPPSSSLKSAQPSVPNREAPEKPGTRRLQPVLSRAAAVVQATEANRPSGAGAWQKSLRSSRSLNSSETPTRNATLSRSLTSRALDLSSSLASSLSIPDSTVSRRTKASTTSSKAVAERNSAAKTSRIAELSHLQEQLEIKSRLLSAMEQQVLDAVQQIEDLQKDRQTVLYEKDVLQEECMQLRTENAGLTGQMKHLKEARTKLHRRCQEAEESMDQLKKQLDDMKANSDVACVSADICKAALAQSLSEALAIHFRMLEAQSLLQNCQSELEMHRRHVRQLSDMLEQMHCQLSGALDQLEQATNSERNLKAQLATLQSEINTALDRLSASQQQQSALEAQELQLLTQLEQLMSDRLPSSTDTLSSLSISTESQSNPHKDTDCTHDSELVKIEAGECCADVDAMRDQGPFAGVHEVIEDVYETCSQNSMSQTRLQEWLKAALQQSGAMAQVLDYSPSSVYSDTPNAVNLLPPEFLLHWANGKQLSGSCELPSCSLDSSPQVAGSPQADGLPLPADTPTLQRGRISDRSAVLAALIRSGGIIGNPEAVQKLLQTDEFAPPQSSTTAAGPKSHLLVSADLLQSLMPFMALQDGEVNVTAGWHTPSLTDRDDASSPQGINDAAGTHLPDRMKSQEEQDNTHRACGVDMLQYSQRDQHELEFLLHDMLELQGCCRYLLDLPSLRNLTAPHIEAGPSTESQNTLRLQRQSGDVALPAASTGSLGTLTGGTDSCIVPSPVCASQGDMREERNACGPSSEGLFLNRGPGDADLALEVMNEPYSLLDDRRNVAAACATHGDVLVQTGTLKVSHKLWEAKEKLQKLLEQVSEAAAAVAQQVILAGRAAALQLPTPAGATELPVVELEENPTCSVDVGGELSSSSSSVSIPGKRRWVVAEPESFIPEGLEDPGFMEHITGCLTPVSDVVLYEQEADVAVQLARTGTDGLAEEVDGSSSVMEACHPEVQKWRQQLRELQHKYSAVLAVFARYGGNDTEVVRQLQWVTQVLRAGEERAHASVAAQLPSVQVFVNTQVLLEEQVQKLEEAALRLGNYENQVMAAEQKLSDRERVHHAEVTSILEEAAKRLGEAEKRFREAEQQLGSKDELYNNDVTALRLQVDERDRKLQEKEQQLTELAEKLAQGQQQQSEAALQLKEREAQLVHTLGKFERLELQLQLAARSLPGQLPNSFHPAFQQLAQRPERLLFSSPLLERAPSHAPLQRYTARSLSRFISQYKLHTAMHRTVPDSILSACTNPACTCPCCINASPLDCPPTPAMRSVKSSSTLDTPTCSGIISRMSGTGARSGADGVVSRRRSHFCLGRRLFLIGVPGAVLVVACIWVAELLRNVPVKAPLVEKKPAVVKPQLPRFPWQRDS